MKAMARLVVDVCNCIVGHGFSNVRPRCRRIGWVAPPPVGLRPRIVKQGSRTGIVTAHWLLTDYRSTSCQYQCVDASCGGAAGADPACTGQQNREIRNFDYTGLSRNCRYNNRPFGFNIECDYDNRQVSGIIRRDRKRVGRWTMNGTGSMGKGFHAEVFSVWGGVSARAVEVQGKFTQKGFVRVDKRLGALGVH